MKKCKHDPKDNYAWFVKEPYVKTQHADGSITVDYKDVLIVCCKKCKQVLKG